MIRIFDKIDEVKDSIHEIELSLTQKQTQSEIKIDFIKDNIEAALRNNTSMLSALNNVNWTRTAKGIGIVIGAIMAAIGSYFAAVQTSQIAASPPVIEETDTDHAIDALVRNGKQGKDLN